MESNGSPLPPMPRPQLQVRGSTARPPLRKGLKTPVDEGIVLLPTKKTTVPKNHFNKRMTGPPGEMGHGGIRPGAFDEAPPRWKPTPVVEWIETLMAATEAEEAAVDRNHPGEIAATAAAALDFEPRDDASESGRSSSSMSSTSKNNKFNPICLNGIPMSYPSFLPQSAPWALRLKPTASSPNFQNAMETLSIDQTSTNASSSAASTRSIPQSSWDMSTIYDLDPYAWLYMGEIAKLAQEWDKIVNQNTVVEARLHAAYKRLQIRLDVMARRILGQNDCRGTTAWENDEARQLMNFLYQDTITKLERLVSLARGDPEEGEAETHPGTAAAAAKGQLSPAEEKKFLANYMTDWLKTNWVNPYPDEVGLRKMAAACGTSTTVVSNWLINARTRKWRPSILKALDLQRPAQELLANSLRIFGGERISPSKAGYSTTTTHLGDSGSAHWQQQQQQQQRGAAGGSLPMQRRKGNKRCKRSHDNDEDAAPAAGFNQAAAPDHEPMPTEM
ncbi:hypothetical protein ACA910_014544 [Epithemia clementina (nom. ined.)]